MEWEAEARKAEDLGMRVVTHPHRRGAVRGGGALEKMLPPFKLGVGGPVAGGDQYVPWIHIDDVVGRADRSASTTTRRSGPVNLSAPEPVTNKELSKALGRVLKRPAFAPVPGFAVKLLYGEMAQIVTTGRADGARAPARSSGYDVPPARPRAGAALGDGQVAPAARRGRAGGAAG